MNDYKEKRGAYEALLLDSNNVDTVENIEMCMNCRPEDRV